jgi:hypothetical protein
MRRTLLETFGILLITVSAVQLNAASARYIREEPVTNNELFRSANDTVGGRDAGFCSQEPGNPYDERTDFEQWSAWRASGAWDGRNDCR